MRTLLHRNGRYAVGCTQTMEIVSQLPLGFGVFYEVVELDVVEYAKKLLRGENPFPLHLLQSEIVEQVLWTSATIDPNSPVRDLTAAVAKSQVDELASSLVTPPASLDLPLERQNAFGTR